MEISLRYSCNNFRKGEKKDCVQKYSEDFTLKSKWNMALEFSLHQRLHDKVKTAMKLHFTPDDHREMFLSIAIERLKWWGILDKYSVKCVKLIFRSSQFHFCEAWPQWYQSYLQRCISNVRTKKIAVNGESSELWDCASWCGCDDARAGR